MPLATIGELSYNGVPFDASSKVSPRVEFRKDASNRTTTSQVVTLDVESIFSFINDTSMQDARVALGRQGGALRFTGHGFGLNVNTGEAGSSVDVAFGPSPRILDWESLGPGNGTGASAKVRWQVTTEIPNCSGSVQVFKEFCYSISTTVKDNGYRVKTITGHYTIPLGRYSSLTGSTRVVSDRASNYRELALSIFERPANCKRSQDFQESLDKTTESFTITDTEIESERPLPQNVVAIDCRHRIGWALKDAGNARNRLTAAITMAPGWGSMAALTIFRQLCDQRLRRALEYAEANGITFLIDSIDAEEAVFGKTHVFSIAYRLTGNPDAGVKTENRQDKGDKPGTSLALGSRFLELSAFGAPVAGLNWMAWANSMYRNGTGPYGPRGLHDNYGGHIFSPPDTINDLCYTDSSFSGFTTFTPPPSDSDKGVPSAFVPLIPKEHASWLRYSHEWQEMDRVYDSNKVVQLAKAKVSESKIKSAAKDGTQGAIVDLYTSPIIGDEDRIFRTLKRGMGQTWFLQGYGERVAYKLPRLPATILLREEKATLSLIQGFVHRTTKTSPLGVKVHRGSFAGIYISNKELENSPPAHNFP